MRAVDETLTAATPEPRFGIEHGASWLPPLRRHLRDWSRVVGRKAEELVDKMTTNGLGHYHVAEGLNVADIALESVANLLAESGRSPRDVDLVIYCHTINSSVLGAPTSIPALIQQRFGMTNARGFSIAQQNCSSAVCAIRLVRSLMWRHAELDNVIVVSADKVHDEAWRNISYYAIQSDGGSALWLSRGARRNVVGAITYSHDARYYQGVAKSAALSMQFSLNYAVNAHFMISQVMQQSGWSLADVEALLPMNANLTAFKQVVQMLGLPLEKLYTRNISEVGHVCCSDPIMNFLERFRRDPGTGNAILFASSSSGIFSAIAVHAADTARRIVPAGDAHGRIAPRPLPIST